MFLAYNKSIPQVDDIILHNLGPRDLVNAKGVCRDWAMSVRRYIGRMGTKKTSDLIEEAFRQPVSTYATVKLPHTVRDLTVNDRGDVYILGDESITQLDPVNLQVKGSIMLDTMAENDGYVNGFFLYANTDGSQFVIRRTFKGHSKTVVSYGLKYDQSKSVDQLTRAITEDEMRRNKDVIGLPMRYSGKGVPKCRGSGLDIFTNTCRCPLHKTKKALGASDLVRLPNGACLYAKEIESYSDPKTLLIHWRKSGYVSIARIPMCGVKIRVAGTRVLCFSKILEKGAQSDCIMAFDIWNPDSLHNCGDNVEITKN